VAETILPHHESEYVAPAVTGAARLTGSELELEVLPASPAAFAVTLMEPVPECLSLAV
jgi:hypothetical protein